MSANAVTTVSLTFKMQTDGTEQSMQDIARSVEAVRSALNSTMEPAENLRTRLINYNEIARSFRTITESVDTVNGIFQDLTAAYRVQEDVETRLEAVMKRTMGARVEDVQAIKDLTAAQQQIGIIGDEVQLAGAQELATYLELRSSLETLIPVMNDMVAQQYAFGASGENAAQIATMLGKVMQGQTGALSRYGYTFDEAQEKILKTGTEMERAAMLAEVVSESVGGVNQSLAQTDSGKAQQLANALGDVKEQLGGMVRNIAPYVDLTSQVLSSINALASLRASVLALIPSLNSASTSTRILGITIRTTTTAARVMAVALRAALIGTGIGAAIAALSWLMEKLTGSTAEAGKEMAATGERIRNMADVTRDAATRATEQRVRIEALIKVMDDETRSMKDRTKAQRELNSTIDDFNARLDATGQKFRYNKQALDDYISSLQKAYTVEGAKDLLTDLGRNKAEIIIERERVKKRYEEMRDSNAAGTSPETRRIVAARNGATNSSQLTAVNNSLDSFEKVELGALDKREKEIDAEMEAISKVIEGYETSPAPAPNASSSSGRGGTRHEETRYEKLNRLISETVAKADTLTEEEARSARSNITAWQEEIRMIELRRAELTRPDTLETARNYDDEINYQTALLATQRGAEAARTTERLRALKMEKGALTEVADTLPRQITTYEELDEAIAYYDRRLQKATATQRISIELVKKSLTELREEWQKAAAPPEIPTDTLMENLETAITDITSRVGDRQGTVTVRTVGMEEAARQIKEITRLFEQFGDRMSSTQREALEKSLEAYRKYGREAARSISTVSSSWNSLKGIGNGIESISDALTRQQSLWKALTGVIDGALSVVQGVRGVIQLINSLSVVTQTAATTTTAVTVAESAAASEETAAYSALAAAKTFAAHAYIPFAGTEIAAGFVAAQQSVIAAAAIPKFAEGGIVYGPTLALTGEYAGAASNPEVIAPLDKLRGLLDNSREQGPSGVVRFEIDGNRLVGVLANTTRVGARSGRRTNIIL